MEAPRRRHAVEQDARILAAARDLLIGRPGSSMAEVGAAAGVGMSALYSRFGSRAALLRRFADEGNRVFAAAFTTATDALEAGADAHDVLVGFLSDAEVVEFAAFAAATDGTFERSPAEVEESRRLQRHAERMVAALHGAGALRSGVGWLDLAKLLLALGSIRGDGPDRTRLLQARFLRILLDGLRGDLPALEGPGAEDGDFAWRRRPAVPQP